MRRLLRRTLAPISASLIAIPAHIAVEIAVVAAFVCVLLAIATPGDHRSADASAAHFIAERPGTGEDAQPPACPPDSRGKQPRSIAAPPVAAPGPRCRDLRSYV